MNKWRAESYRVIRRTLKGVPGDAPAELIEDLLRDAYPFGERKYTPYREWRFAVLHTIKQRAFEWKYQAKQAMEATQ